MMNKRTLLSTTILLAMSAGSVQAIPYASTGNNFSMLLPDGTIMGPGGTNDVVMTWDGTINTYQDYLDDTIQVNMTLTSETGFFNTLWYAHDISVFGPGTYTFDTCANNTPEQQVQCFPITMSVDDGQLGVHMLFDWNTALNIDVLNVWDINSVFGDGTNMKVCGPITIGKNCNISTDPWSNDPLTVWSLASTDDDGNGALGIPLVDGPFPGFNPNFNLMLQPVPVPAAVWLMGSGLLGLIGVARKKKQ